MDQTLSNNSQPPAEEHPNYSLSSEDAIFTTLSLTGMILDSFIIIAILKFSNLQTKRNKLIKHWITSDFLFQLTQPALYGFFVLFLRQKTFSSFLTHLEVLHNATETLKIVMIAVLFIDCVYKKITNLNLTFMIVLAVSFLIYLVDMTIFHYIGDDLLPVFNLLLVVFVLLCLACKSIICTIRFVKSKEKACDMRLVLAVGYMSFWFLFLVVNSLVQFGGYWSLMDILDVLLILLQGNSLVQFVLICVGSRSLRGGVKKLILGGCSKDDDSETEKNCEEGK